jgi:hypothetical protein
MAGWNARLMRIVSAITAIFGIAARIVGRPTAAHQFVDGKPVEFRLNSERSGSPFVGSESPSRKWIDRQNSVPQKGCGIDILGTDHGHCMTIFLAQVTRFGKRLLSRWQILRRGFKSAILVAARIAYFLRTERRPHMRGPYILPARTRASMRRRSSQHRSSGPCRATRPLFPGHRRG